jgi:hypothetical protein
VEDDDYRIHYTITRSQEAVFLSGGNEQQVQGGGIFGANESYSVGSAVERKLSVLNEGKEGVRDYGLRSRLY